MNLGQLHVYLGLLLEVGADPKAPVVLPGADAEDWLQELTSAYFGEGQYLADPSPKMVGHQKREGAFLLLHGQQFDTGPIWNEYSLDWPLLDAPAPDDEDVDSMLNCPRCKTRMRRGQAYVPPPPMKREGQKVGASKLKACLKCPGCGHSETA